VTGGNSFAYCLLIGCSLGNAQCKLSLTAHDIMSAKTLTMVGT
jgi:hypothetical protein